MQNKLLRFNSKCILCILNKYLNKVPVGTKEQIKLSYSTDVLKFMSTLDGSMTAPEVVAKITEIKNSYFGNQDDFGDIKKYFNNLMLSYEKEYLKAIEQSQNMLYTAVCFAMLGNYIDFGAMQSVDEQRLKQIPQDAEKININKVEFEHFTADLNNAKSLVYLTDNCGEIVMDKLLINVIKVLYPRLKISVIVRGRPVLNDATIEDVAQVGITNIAEVYENGTGIAGTCIDKISNRARELVEQADVIISKGQGNFETLFGCNKNIYYLFLCKCDLFAERFMVPKLTGMFLNDRRI